MDDRTLRFYLAILGVQAEPDQTARMEAAMRKYLAVANRQYLGLCDFCGLSLGTENYRHAGCYALSRIDTGARL